MGNMDSMHALPVVNSTHCSARHQRDSSSTCSSSVDSSCAAASPCKIKDARTARVVTPEGCIHCTQSVSSQMKGISWNMLDIDGPCCKTVELLFSSFGTHLTHRVLKCGKMCLDCLRPVPRIFEAAKDSSGEASPCNRNVLTLIGSVPALHQTLLVLDT